MEKTGTAFEGTTLVHREGHPLDEYATIPWNSLEDNWEEAVVYRAR